MHISIFAAILIIGLLFLATSKAGLKVLGVVALVGCVVVGFLLYASYQDEQAILAKAQLPCTSKEEGREIPMDEWVARSCYQRTKNASATAPAKVVASKETANQAWCAAHPTAIDRRYHWPLCAD